MADKTENTKSRKLGATMVVLAAVLLVCVTVIVVAAIVPAAVLLLVNMAMNKGKISFLPVKEIIKKAPRAPKVTFNEFAAN